MSSDTFAELDAALDHLDTVDFNTPTEAQAALVRAALAFQLAMEPVYEVLDTELGAGADPGAPATYSSFPKIRLPRLPRLGRPSAQADEPNLAEIEKRLRRYSKKAMELLQQSGAAEYTLTLGFPPSVSLTWTRP